MDDITIGVGIVDVVVFSSTVILSILIGVYFANKNKTMSEYMLGEKNMSIFPVGVSMMTSFLSGITLVATPYEVYSQGWSYALTGIACMVAGPIVAYLIVPVFYHSNYLSIYQYLEDRYSKRVKHLVSGLFMVQMILYNSMVLFVPSMSLQAVTGIDSKYMILAMGITCSIYSTLGGIKAVIWTDLFQGSLMILSLLVISIKGTIDAGGLSKIWSVAKSGGRLDVEHTIFNFDLTTRHTVFNILTGSVILNLYMNAANQIQVQRAFSLPSIEKAQRAIVLSTPLSCLLIWMSCYTGLILYDNYVNCDPLKNGDIRRMDSILPLYVVQHLTIIPGLCGLFIAGIVSATLSTISSFANSMAAVTVDNYINQFRQTPMSDRTSTLVSKFFAFFYSMLCVALSFAVDYISGLLQAALTLFGLLGAPFLASFLLGMHTKFCNSTGIIWGMSVSISLSLLFEVGRLYYATPLVPLPLLTIDCPNYHQPKYNVSNLELNLIEATGCLRIPDGCGLVRDVVRHEEFLQHQQQLIDASQQDRVNIFDISYMWLPVISLLTTVFVTILVSLMTGGRRQYVNDKCLFSSLGKSKSSQQVRGMTAFW